MAASLQGEPGPTPAGKTLPHSYPETRFRRERARGYIWSWEEAPRLLRSLSQNAGSCSELPLILITLKKGGETHNQNNRPPSRQMMKCVESGNNVDTISRHGKDNSRHGKYRPHSEQDIEIQVHNHARLWKYFHVITDTWALLLIWGPTILVILLGGKTLPRVFQSRVVSY